MSAQRTTHRILYSDSRSPGALAPCSVDLVVTSPPYPMIEMWDGLFGGMEPAVGRMLAEGDGEGAFAAMHATLDQVWRSLDEKVKPGGVLCINVGDATRTLGGSFRLYPNHTRVSAALQGLGYQPLPEILWRKPSNKPNKFMGSGMLPPGAYVTQEHEYILVFRKGGKREFSAEDLARRRQSAFFWEERNEWFSDVWEGLKGERQPMKGGSRPRSGAYPFELAHRLVSMFSVQGDVVADPFAGTCTTAVAAMACARNSASFELEPAFRAQVESRISGVVQFANEYNLQRVERHLKSVGTSGQARYRNEVYGFPVMTRQETSLWLPRLSSVRKLDDETYEVDYSPIGDR